MKYMVKVTRTLRIVQHGYAVVDALSPEQANDAAYECDSAGIDWSEQDRSTENWEVIERDTRAIIADAKLTPLSAEAELARLHLQNL